MNARIGVTILGSTGSIGTNTLAVLALHRDQFRVFALAAHNNADKLFAQCVEFRPVYAVLGSAEAAIGLQQRLRAIAGKYGVHRQIPPVVAGKAATLHRILLRHQQWPLAKLRAQALGVVLLMIGKGHSLLQTKTGPLQRLEKAGGMADAGQAKRYSLDMVLLNAL